MKPFLRALVTACKAWYVLAHASCSPLSVTLRLLEHVGPFRLGASAPHPAPKLLGAHVSI